VISNTYSFNTDTVTNIDEEQITLVRDHNDGDTQEYKRARKALREVIKDGIELPENVVEWTRQYFSMSGLNKVAVAIMFDYERQEGASVLFDDDYRCRQASSFRNITSYKSVRLQTSSPSTPRFPSCRRYHYEFIIDNVNPSKWVQQPTIFAGDEFYLNFGGHTVIIAGGWASSRLRKNVHRQ
jgi:hypothetical protein